MTPHGSTHSTPTPRRGFLRDVARGGALLGLTTWCVAMVRRTRRLAGEHTCLERGICGRCRLYRGCSLPQATLARRRTNGGAS